LTSRRPSGLVSHFGVEHPGPWWNRSFMENPTFIEASLSDVRETTLFMGVLVVEFLC
jgi:hypothetical protein